MTATQPRTSQRSSVSHGTPGSATSASGSPATSYYLLLSATAILLVVGMAVVLSSSSIHSISKEGGNPYALFLIQLAAMAVGMIGLGVGSRMPIAGWKRVAPVALYVSFALLALVLTRGIASGGNRNWIRVGIVTAQPSEVAKLGLALYLGVVLATFRKELTTLRRIMVPGGIATLAVLAFVLAGKDMGTAIIVLVLAAAAFWAAGLPIRFFVAGSLFIGVAMTLLVWAADSRVARLNTWLSPTCDATDECYQQTHGTWALASGGLWGLGPGMSREKWGYLPAADNDFIYAIIGEEFGLIGTLIVLLALAMIVIAVNRIVRRHRDPFVKIGAASIGAWIVGQALINIAVVLELLPVTGVPLPLVSSGGSSLIMSLVGIGALMAFARTEPGAPEAFSARPSVMKRYVAVLSRGRRG